MASSTDGLNFVSRAEWGARKPKNSYGKINGAVAYVFIHHTTGKSSPDQTTCSALIRNHQSYHIDKKGWNDIGYSFVIGGDGQVYIGRNWGNVGAHTYGYNSRGYGIAFLGTFDNSLPDSKATAAAKKLIQQGINDGYLTKDYGLYAHKDVVTTDCPGNALYEHVKTWSHWHEKPLT